MDINKINNNPLLKLTFEFSLRLIEYCELLDENRKFVISNQLLKSGTSIGANSIESQNSESKNDFIHKLKIAAKEAEETEYWLLLCKFLKDFPICEHLLTKLDDTNRLLGKIISTSKKNNITI
jgi:four helix bundle protein